MSRTPAPMTMAPLGLAAPDFPLSAERLWRALQGADKT